jgi:hypothetical protein
VHWDTLDRLEQKDIEANWEKMINMSAKISRLEGEFGVLPAESADSVLENDRAG